MESQLHFACLKSFQNVLAGEKFPLLQTILTSPFFISLSFGISYVSMLLYSLMISGAGYWSAVPSVNTYQCMGGDKNQPDAVTIDVETGQQPA